MLGFAKSARQWIYEQKVTGPWQRLRKATFTALHLILFVTPWIRIKGNPAILIDLPNRTLYAFGAIFTAEDTIFLLFLLLFLAFSLFFFTSLFGRLWCGFACPQTVFLDTWIRPLEEWIEGDWVRRRKRDEGAWTLDRVWRKAAKWILFAAIAIVISMAFGSYFAGARELWSGRGSATEYTLVGIFAAVWFFDLAWFREQFCNYLCPYARFQSALTDEDTLLVQYDTGRGEPRGGADARTDGRCIECNKCVFVCPQGIDIREGFQLECIACARCIDACDIVMDKLGHRTLITWGAMAELKGRAARRLRPRTMVYAGLLTAIAAAGITLLAGRTPFDADVNRAPGSLFTVDRDGYIRNTYLLRVTNKEAAADSVPFHVRVDGLPGAQVVVEDLRLGTTESRTVPLIVRVPASAKLPRTIPIAVHVGSPEGEVRLDATFKTGGHLDAQ
ncbi:MAG TPA: cytochrome c oxidase accessory protein CcoG [Candidatus Polarisedimenticolia bacterium]|nr:cytochrome c oxidase accessory protein CcoG [Candidatus Polarisedimenticolia bacterium]